MAILPPPVPLDFLTGYCNFPRETCKVHASILFEDEWVPLHVAAKRHTISKRHVERKFACTENTRHGEWYIGSYDIPERSLVEFTFYKKDPLTGPFGLTKKLRIRMRNGAALRCLSINVAESASAEISKGTIFGRFDLVETDTTDYETFIRDAHAGLDDEDNYYFIQHELVKQETERYKVREVQEEVTESGKLVKVQKPRVRRVLNLKRRS